MKIKPVLALAGIVFVAAAGWHAGAYLSDDAARMAVGVLFGAMAGIPTAIMVIASNRRRPEPPVKPWCSAYQPLQLPEPAQWHVAEMAQRRIDATVTAKRIEAKHV